jgi:hypothetical protein
MLLLGCKVAVNSGGQRFTGADVTFVVPLQTSEVSNGPAGIHYKSDGFNASTDGKTLLFNGKSYGALKPGDIVDFTEPGVVNVNGVPRTADGT